MNDPCDVVLYSLQLVDGAGWSAVEHSTNKIKFMYKYRSVL